MTRHEPIFTRYGSERAGAHTIATDLNDDGHRTRTGRRFSAKVVLGILRNRGYPGEVSFRDARHRPRRCPHRPRHRALHARRRIPDRSPRTWPAPRVRDLGNKVRARRGRHAELGEAAETADLEPPTAANIEALRQLFDDEIERRNEEHRKAIAQAFVSDLVVKERDTIQPTF